MGNLNKLLATEEKGKTACFHCFPWFLESSGTLHRRQLGRRGVLEARRAEARGQPEPKFYNFCLTLTKKKKEEDK